MYIVYLIRPRGKSRSFEGILQSLWNLQVFKKDNWLISLNFRLLGENCCTWFHAQSEILTPSTSSSFIRRKQRKWNWLHSRPEPSQKTHWDLNLCFKLAFTWCLGLLRFRFFMPPRRRNSARDKVIVENRFIRIGCLWEMQVDRQGSSAPRIQ